MNIKNNTIFFKSTYDNYTNESSGLKKNTVRRLKDINELNQFLYFKNHLNVESKICIICKENEKDFFIRNITNITEFEDLFIISWN